MFISKKNLLKISIYIIIFALISIFYFSLIPKFNGFPTGTDAAAHITWARSIADGSYPPNYLWKGENPSPYPLPEIIFAFIHKTTNYPLIKLFPIIVVIFILINIFIASLIAKNIFGYFSGIVTLILGAGFPFLSDHLTVGTMPEIFGMIVFLLMIYCFVLKKYYYIPLLFIIGLFSHPFVGLISTAIFVSILPFSLLSNKFRIYINKKKKFIFFIILSIILLAVLFLIFRESLIRMRLFNMLLADTLIISGGKSYLPIELINKIKILPIFYIFSLLGIIALLFKKNSINKKIVIFFIPVILLLCFNHLLYINIEPYRFIPYLEIMISIFASGGILFLINKLSFFFKRRKIYLLFIFLTLLFPLLLVIENHNRIQKIINWYSNPESMAKLPQEDLKVMQWINKENIISNKDYICSLYKWGYWIPAIAQKKVIFGGYEKVSKDTAEGCNQLYLKTNKEEIQKIAKKENLKYIYFSSHQTTNPEIIKNFELLYQEGKAAIYKLY